MKEAHSKLLFIETWNTTVAFLPNPRIISADSIKKHDPSGAETGNIGQTGIFALRIPSQFETYSNGE